MNIALFSPNQNVYSETFIQAHKLGLAGKVFYYYGAGQSIRLEGENRRKSPGLLGKVWRKALGKPRFKTEDWLLDSLQTHEIDVILIEYGNHAHSLLSVLRKVDIPFVVHFHGYDAHRNDIIAACNDYKEVFDAATYVVAVSQHMKAHLQELGCSPNKLVYTPCGPKTSFKAITPNFSQKAVLSVGRFVDKKAPYYTVLAFKEVLEKHPDAQLLMAGAGPLLNTCVNLVRFHNMQDSVQFLGVISPEQVQEYLGKVQVFTQHSIITQNGDREGTPVGVMEASLAGLPVVSTQHAGIPDVILDGKTGYLVPEHDVHAMAEKISDLLGDTEALRSMGLKGKEYISAHFTLEHHLDILNKTLKEAVC